MLLLFINMIVLFYYYDDDCYYYSFVLTVLQRQQGSFVVGSKLYIVTPYLALGSCLDIMKCAFADGLEEPVIGAILKQALLGLEYLHRNGHIHRYLIHLCCCCCYCAHLYNINK